MKKHYCRTCHWYSQESGYSYANMYQPGEDKGRCMINPPVGSRPCTRGEDWCSQHSDAAREIAAAARATTDAKDETP